MSADRPSWDQVWMNVAVEIAQRSKCDGRRIGAVIASQDNGYTVVGYNGPPAGWMPANVSTCSGWCTRMQTGERSTSYGNCMTAHAEANALVRADHSRIQGGTIYVTSACCWECAKLVANSGIKRVVMSVDEEADAHREPSKTRAFLKECGLTVEVFQ